MSSPGHRKTRMNTRKASPYGARRGQSPSKIDGGILDGVDLHEEQLGAGSEVLVLHQPKDTLDDEDFFEDLPMLLSDVGEKLARLLDIEVMSIKQMDELDAMPDHEDEEEEEEEEEEPEGEEGEEGDEQAEGDAASVEGKPATAGDPEPEADAKADPEGVEAGEDAEAEGATGAAEGDDSDPKDEPDNEEDPAAAGDTESADPDATPAGEDDSPTEAAAGASADAEIESTGEDPALEGEGAVETEAPVESIQETVQEVPAISPVAEVAKVVDEGPNEEELEQRMLKMSKGMPKLDWSGAPLMNTINIELRGMIPDLSVSTRKTKGRKKADKPVQLERILGYTRPDTGDDDADQDAEEDDEKDGVLERDSIKRMAAKMEARAAKEKADKAAL